MFISILVQNTKRQEFFITLITIFCQKWADPEKLSFLQAVKIINYRMRNKNSDNMKLEDIKIDTLIQEIKEK